MATPPTNLVGGRLERGGAYQPVMRIPLLRGHRCPERRQTRSKNPLPCPSQTYTVVAITSYIVLVGDVGEWETCSGPMLVGPLSLIITPQQDPNQSELGDRTGRKPSSFFRKHFANTWSEKRPKKEDGEDEEEIHHRAGLHLLHSSPDPLIDLIFIHGLKGHPVKTWRKSGEPRSFWPQYWLPADPEFYHVNIHTFGYEVDWADSKSSTILNINDFGQALLEEMRNSPHLRNNERVSMGI